LLMQGADKGPGLAGATNALFSTNDPPQHATSPEKRRASASSPNKSTKRPRISNTSPNANGASFAKGQQSLKGFFQTRSKVPESHPAATGVPPVVCSTPPIGDAKPASAIVAAARTDTTPSPAAASASQTTTSPSLVCDPGAAQQASKEGWTKLFSKRPPPRCEGHAEPCITLTTKKPGVNRGRQFWMCSRYV
jgi:AP endonuclease-2